MSACGVYVCMYVHLYVACTFCSNAYVVHQASQTCFQHEGDEVCTEDGVSVSVRRSHAAFLGDSVSGFSFLFLYVGTLLVVV